MKSIKIMMFSALLAVFVAFNVAIPAFAYTVPSDSYYIDCDTREVGRIKIYVPYNMGKYFSSTDSGGIVSNYSSNITCWGTTDTGTTQYDIRFPLFDLPEYRRANYTGSSNQYADLTITKVNSTNLPLLSDTDFTLISQANIVNMIMVFIGGSILLFTILKKG